MNIKIVIIARGPTAPRLGDAPWQLE